MLGVDPYWERIHLAYDFFYNHPQYHIPRRQAEVEFEPGEIAHIEDEGTLVRGLYDFLEWQGLPITRQEIIVRDKAKDRGTSGRMCLVLQRLADGRYLICYLASFRQVTYGADIQSPLARLFSIALEDTPEFPEGTPSIKIIPKWGVHGFLYALPIPRRKLVRHKARDVRFMLRLGELERVKRLILDRVQIFKAHHVQLREEEIQRKKLNIDSGRGHRADPDPAGEWEDLEVETTNMETALTDMEAETLLPLAALASRVQRRPKIRLARPPVPRIHYLETNPHWFNLRWSLENMHTDITQSSYPINSLRVYRGVRWMMHHFPIR